MSETKPNQNTTPHTQPDCYDIELDVSDTFAAENLEALRAELLAEKEGGTAAPAVEISVLGHADVPWCVVCVVVARVMLRFGDVVVSHNVFTISKAAAVVGLGVLSSHKMLAILALPLQVPPDPRRP